MGKKTKVKNEIPMKVIDLLNIIKNEWINFYKTDDVDRKLQHIIDMMISIWVYDLVRYDYENFTRLREMVLNKENKEEQTNEH